MLVPALVFVVLLAGILAAYWLFVVRPEQQAVSVVQKRLKALRRPRRAVRNPALGLVAKERELSTIAPLNRLLKRERTWVEALQNLTEQSGTPLTVGGFLMLSAVLGLIVFLFVHRLTGMWALGLLAAPVAALVPAQILRFMRTRRMRTFEDQFPEALDLISRAMRAGHAFTTGIEMVGNEMPRPLGPEFRLLYDRQNYGMAMPDALKAFAQRIPILDARFFVTAVLIQRESGGNLSEILENLSDVIRERQRVKRQMRVLSAHGRITGWVLAALPPALAFALMSANPEHRSTMLDSTLGVRMLIGAGVLQLIGSLVIRKIVNVEY